MTTIDVALEIAGVILAVAGLHGGFAAALSLLRGDSADEIGAAATKGAAAGFIVGLAIGTVLGVYRVLS